MSSLTLIFKIAAEHVKIHEIWPNVIKIIVEKYSISQLACGKLYDNSSKLLNWDKLVMLVCHPLKRGTNINDDLNPISIHMI